MLAPAEAVQLNDTDALPPIAVNPVGWPGTAKAVTVTVAVWLTLALAEFVTVSV